MRIRSTGLGKTELILKPDNLAIKEGCLLFSLRTTEPVNWRVRVLVERKDIGKLFLLMLKGSPFLWLLSALFRKPSPPPTDY